MKEVMLVIFGIILSIAIILISLAIGALIFWGLGNLIIYLFNINYTWTFLHGLASYLVIEIIMAMFK